MAKDKKAKTAEKKARVAAKQNKKAAQKDKKSKAKGTDDSDAEDVDLESVLADYAKKQEQFLKVTESSCEPPSPRSSATFIGSPSNTRELFLFGGEYYNGALATFYNDLFIYNTDREDWRKVTSPNSPLPRSGHAWCRGGNAGGIYLFGGEFSSPKQGTFYHYNDFWRLQPSTREWTRIEVKGKSPPARSGHRLVYYKNYIILFGGFQDTSSQTKYLQDLWIYDCQNFLWHNPVLPPAKQKPDPRSSFSFLPHESGAVLYGGYSRVKANAAAGKQTKGGSQTSKSVMKPTIHQDTWFLRITQPSAEMPSATAPSVRWERRKKPANAPNPPRAGVTQAYHKGRGISFGGVHDVEESEQGIESEFFDQLFAFNLERNRFFPLTLRRPRIAPKKQIDDRMTRRDRAKADEAELLRNLSALETKGSIAEHQGENPDPMMEDEEKPVKPVKPILERMPHPRFNAQLAVQGDVLYIFGGTYEHGDREYTFDEMYEIDLGKLNGVREIFRRELDDWVEEEAEDESESDEEYSEDDDMDDGVGLPAATAQATPADCSMSTEEQNDVLEDEQAEAAVVDERPHPRPFESLRDFFSRTSTAWQEFLLEKADSSSSASNQTGKEIRKTAFEFAETKWWDCREEIIAEEERQEEAGIGEVVSLAERGTETGTVERRR
ncbi:Kelch repeat-containing protein 3 [Lecanora helva]